MSDINLLPCPFCGENVRATATYVDIAAGDMGQGVSSGTMSRASITCRNCGTFNLDAERWNKRHGSAETRLAEARAEALEENTEALEAAKARGRQLTGDQPGALVEAMAEVAAEGAKAYLAAIRALKSGGANG